MSSPSISTFPSHVKGSTQCCDPLSLVFPGSILDLRSHVLCIPWPLPGFGSPWFHLELLVQSYLMLSCPSHGCGNEFSQSPLGKALLPGSSINFSREAAAQCPGACTAQGLNPGHDIHPWVGIGRKEDKGWMWKTSNEITTQGPRERKNNQQWLWAFEFENGMNVETTTGNL